MFLYHNSPRERARLFGQYGGAGVIATRKRTPRFQRKGTRKFTRKASHKTESKTPLKAQRPTQNQSQNQTQNQRASKRGSKRASKRVQRRRPTKRVTKELENQGLETLFKEGKQALQRGLKHGVRRAVKSLPSTAAKIASAAGEYVAPSVMNLGVKALKGIRKRFNPDEDSLGPAQLPIPTTAARTKLAARRRFKGRRPSAHQFVQKMRVKRGAGIYF